VTPKERGFHVPTTRKKPTDEQGPAKSLQREPETNSSLVPRDQVAGPPVPIEIDVTKIAQQANVLDTLGEIKHIIDDCAADVELTEQNTVTREANRDVFQSTRSVRIAKPARPTLASIMGHVTPWSLALVLGSLAIIGVVLIFLL
jgi:hypothetical protein